MVVFLVKGFTESGSADQGQGFEYDSQFAERWKQCRGKKKIKIFVDSRADSLNRRELNLCLKPKRIRGVRLIHGSTDSLNRVHLLLLKTAEKFVYLSDRTIPEQFVVNTFL